MANKSTPGGKASLFAMFKRPSHNSAPGKKHTLQSINEVIQPILKENGFGTFKSNCAWRHTDERIDVLTVEFFPLSLTRKWGLPKSSFGLSAGIFLPFVPCLFSPAVEKDEKSRLLPGDRVCHIRLTPFTPKSKKKSPPNIWVINDEVDLKVVSVEVAAIVNSVVIPWFDSWSSLSDLLTFLDDEEESENDWGNVWGCGRKGSPVRCVIAGFVALKLGKAHSAHNYFSQALERGDLVALSGRSSIVDEIREGIKLSSALLKQK